MLMVDGPGGAGANPAAGGPPDSEDPPELKREKGGDLSKLAVGQRVLATTTTGAQPGTIVACNVNEPGVGVVPYKIQLESGGLVYAPVDDNRCVVPMMSDSVNQSCMEAGQPVNQPVGQPLLFRPQGYVYSGQAQTGSCPNPQTSCDTGCWVPAGSPMPGYPMQCSPMQCSPGQGYPPQGYPPQGQIVLINQ